MQVPRKRINIQVSITTGFDAADLGLRSVRLDVIETTPRARALYEREGYVARSTQYIGPCVTCSDSANRQKCILILRDAAPQRIDKATIFHVSTR